jgi:predicted nucleic acid-binding protein
MGTRGGPRRPTSPGSPDCGSTRADPDDIERYGEPCLCAITRLEILYSTTSPTDYAAQHDALALFRDLRIDAQTIAAAESGQRELATRSQHRISLADLLLGACAHQHGADILHVDRHYDTLAAVFGFRSRRLAV